MGRNVKASEKLQAVRAYFEGKGSLVKIAQQYGVDQSSFQQWVRNYKTIGETAFLRTGHNRSYTAEFKKNVVDEYMAGQGSHRELARKYKIPSADTVGCWIRKYNGYEELKASGRGGMPIMTKGRKTTFEERVEIVKYCIATGHNYNETAEKYEISYQQARNYTTKYEKAGLDGIQDRRGKRKLPDEMNEVERLRAENKILRAEKEHAEMEASFLKKLAEIERRRG